MDFVLLLPRLQSPAKTLFVKFIMLISLDTSRITDWRTFSIVTLQLEDVYSFIKRCPEQYAAIVECTAFVNWRRIEIGKSAVLTLSFYKTSPD